MAIQRAAQAGSLESCDALIQIEPATALTIEVKSDAAAQFGNTIKNTVEATLAELGEKTAKVQVTDRGALDYTLRARVRVAVARAREAKS